jgi:hypothetical protein
MARIRTVKPEFWADEKLGQISRDARLLFIGFWNLSDDFGVCKGHLSWIKSQLFPYDDLSMRKFQNWVNELLDHKFILPFNENGEKFFYIRHFTSHQVINRPSKQRNPSPPKDIESSVSPHGVLPSGREWNGKEGNGMERECEGKPKVKPLSLSSKAKDKPKPYYPDAALTQEERQERYREREQKKDKARRDLDTVLSMAGDAKQG